jgi:hypothetical protein
VWYIYNCSRRKLDGLSGLTVTVRNKVALDLSTSAAGRLGSWTLLSGGWSLLHAMLMQTMVCTFSTDKDLANGRARTSIAGCLHVK